MTWLTTRRQLLAAVAGFYALTGIAGAQEMARPVGVVELFTSQGCSSCPPADALLSELAERDDVISLAYHVDYWDYLGWRDALGSAANTARQKNYARSLQKASVYTPQMIVNGRTDMNGADRSRITASLDSMAGTPDGLQVDLSLQDRGDTILVEVGAFRGDAGNELLDAHLVFVDFAPRATVEIRAGENRGRTIEYRNAVNQIQTIGMWDGTAKSFEMPKSELVKKGNGCALLLQRVDREGRPGAILGAVAITP